MLEIKIGKTSIILPDELEQRLRKAVAERLGFKKGNLQQALIEAVKDWIAKHKKSREIARNPPSLCMP